MARSLYAFITFITLFMLIIFVNCDKYDKELWREFKEFREWKKNQQLMQPKNYIGEIIDALEDNNEEKINWNLEDIPPSNRPDLVGRYVVNHASNNINLAMKIN